MCTESSDVHESLIRSVSEMASTVATGLNGVGESFMAAGAILSREFEILSRGYASLENENRNLDENLELEHLETIRISKKYAELEARHKLELLQTFDAQDKCAAAEARLEAEVRERRKAETKCKEIEEKREIDVLERRRIEKDNEFLCENYRLEKMERIRIEEMYRGLMEKEQNLEEMYEQERLRVEHEHQLVIQDMAKVEEEYNVLEKKHKKLEEECKRFEEMYQIEALEKEREFNKRCEELEEKMRIELMLRLNAQKECEEVKAETKRLTIDLDFERLEKLRIEDELEVMKVEKKKRKVSEEDKEAIYQLLRKNSQLEMEKSALESRIVGLEDDTMRLIGDQFGGLCSIDGRYRSVVNLEKVFHSVTAAHANGTLDFAVREAKMMGEIDKQRKEFETLERMHKFDILVGQKLESECASLKDELMKCKEELERVKEESSVAKLAIDKYEKHVDEVIKKRRDEGEEAMGKKIDRLIASCSGTPLSFVNPILLSDSKDD